MGGHPNYGPLLGPLNIRCGIVLRNQKGTIILTTTHICITPQPTTRTRFRFTTKPIHLALFCDVGGVEGGTFHPSCKTLPTARTQFPENEPSITPHHGLSRLHLWREQYGGGEGIGPCLTHAQELSFKTLEGPLNYQGVGKVVIGLYRVLV